MNYDEVYLRVAMQDCARRQAMQDDVRRLHWLTHIMQKSYDGVPVEDLGAHYLSVQCRMLAGRQDHRIVTAELTWHDQRDQPLGFLAAITSAMDAK